jgi:enterochelin esterase-like enzyme
MVDMQTAYQAQNRTDFMINRFTREDKRNLKIFLDWGLQEDMVLGVNRKLARILDRLGYEYKFMEFNGWHDWSNSRKTFPVGLLYLLEE